MPRVGEKAEGSAGAPVALEKTFPIPEAIQELQKARAAGLFFASDEAAGAAPAVTSSAPATISSLNGAAGALAGGVESAAAGHPPGSPLDQNLQERKNAFLARTGSSDATYVPQPVMSPRSPYEIKAGTIIPTVLLTGINSDLPGQVIGQVRENVYDTVTGNHLLIPLGSRLLASYDSIVAFGQERVLVCWNRLIRPDGSSISLERMPGVDLAGYAGFADRSIDPWPWRRSGRARVRASHAHGNDADDEPESARCRGGDDHQEGRARDHGGSASFARLQGSRAIRASR